MSKKDCRCSCPKCGSPKGIGSCTCGCRTCVSISFGYTSPTQPELEQAGTRTYEQTLETIENLSTQPDYIKEKIQEFREKFTFGGITGSVALKIDNAYEIEQWLSNALEQAEKKVLEDFPWAMINAPGELFIDGVKQRDGYKTVWVRIHKDILLSQQKGCLCNGECHLGRVLCDKCAPYQSTLCPGVLGSKPEDVLEAIK